MRLAERGSLTARVAQTAVYGLKSRVATSRTLVPPLARARGHGVVIDTSTELLIEGYPRSANAFSVEAFEVAHGRRMRIAHHTHAPGHVLAAVRLGVPAIVLARDPADSVLEFLLARSHLRPSAAIRGYLRFYEPLLGGEGFVVGPFPQVTTDFGAVVRRVNERFGTDFTPFEHTDENVQTCFDAMQRHWEQRADGEMLERKVGRPSQVRERMKLELRPVLEAPEPHGLLVEAQALYREFTGGAPLASGPPQLASRDGEHAG